VTAGAKTFEPGDRVEVLGFPESNGSTVNWRMRSFERREAELCPSR
jgi:hypothetical protein